jgi:hypothetical protein
MATRGVNIHVHCRVVVLNFHRSFLRPAMDSPPKR